MLNGTRFDAKMNPGFVSDDIDIITQIALNGGGIARLASFIAQPLIDSGKLIPLFNSNTDDTACAEALPMNIYACVTERSALNAKVRAFIEFLEDKI